jgi:hypothetical protein
VAAADGVAGLDAELGFQRRDESAEKIQDQRVGLFEHGHRLWVDQGRDNDWPMAVADSGFVDAGDAFAGLVDGVDEGHAHLPILDAFELGKQAVAEGFGGDTGAVGNKKYGMPCGLIHRGSGERVG